MAIIPHATLSVKGLRQNSVYHLVASQSAELSIIGLYHSVLTVWPSARSVDDTFVPFEDVEPSMLWVLATNIATLTNQLTKCNITHSFFPFKLFSILRKETVSFAP